MAAARAGVLGVRWLQRASRNIVPMGARTASHITKDMLPGPYPRTPEERAAAAKKYNMRVEDYEPYPDDGMGYGDYPKLPDRSQQERDPWYDWDHPELRLNWGEPEEQYVTVICLFVSDALGPRHVYQEPCGHVPHSCFLESHVDQSSILTIICTWNEVAIPTKNLSRWFTMRSEEASWALCPLTDSLNPRDFTLMKSLIKLSTVVSVPHFPRNSHCLSTRKC
nr:NADH dehydrogenase [ubiquinone] 1 beta subcomplex subunit 8, mitochondrial isoform X1 [Globicephala melas]